MGDRQSGFKNRKRVFIVFILFSLCFVALFGRTAWLQLARGEELSRKAMEQQTTDNTVSAKRGNIYDRNHKVLASNMSVETVSLTPSDIRSSIDKQHLNKDTVAEEMGEILEMDPKTILEKINRESGFEYVKKKVNKDVADALRQYIDEKQLGGVDFVEDVKRNYPYNNLASHLIGFVGSDNQGLEGIESIYDDKLSGVPGRVISTREKTGLDSGNSYESYIEAQDGNSVVLTIDEVVQHFAEKHLENARIANDIQNGAAAIVIDVNTGEILAMTSKPDYDLNAPFEITDAIKTKFPNIEDELKNLTGTEYNTKLNEGLQVVRRNKSVVDSYEPGSTFKSIVASVALESGSCTLHDSFSCGGSMRVADRSIACANRNGHGTQDFAHAVQNSCNPAFIQIGQKIGKDRFLDGIKAFGFLQETGIELPGETPGVGHPEDSFTEIDLATSSFGQSFTVTPLQMVTAVSAVANGGTLYKPHLVKEILGSNGEVVERKEPEKVRQPISKQTSDTMCEILESVVSEGGGKNAYLAGYRIAGKTGTSEKIPRGNGKYIASFIGFAPADDPQVLCLVILDEPAPGRQYYGGMIAAPVVKNILEDTLQYLGVEPQYKEDEKEYVDIEVPDISGKTKEEAEKILKEAGFTLRMKGEGEMITDQIPKAHTKAASGSSIVGYTEGAMAQRSVTVPDVSGLTVAEARSNLIGDGLNARIKGVSSAGIGVAVCASQSPEAGTIVEPGTVVTVDFKYENASD